MTKKELQKYKEQVLECFEKLKNKGTEFTKWTCPHCIKPNETMKAFSVSKKGYWDSLKSCYECGQASFVKTWPSGKTEAINLKTL